MLSRSSAPILEEEIFPACNLDPDCDTIGRLLYEYDQKFILSALENGGFHDLKNAKTFLERHARL